MGSAQQMVSFTRDVSDMVLLNISDADADAAFDCALHQPYFGDKWDRTSTERFINSYVGNCGEIGILNYLTKHGISCQLTHGQTNGRGGDIDMIARGYTQDFTIESKTSHLPDRYSTFNSFIDNCDIKIFQNHNNIEEDLNRDIMAQIIIARTISEEKEFAEKMEPLVKDSFEELANTAQAFASVPEQRDKNLDKRIRQLGSNSGFMQFKNELSFFYSERVYFVCWNTKKQIIRRSNSMQQKTWQNHGRPMWRSPVRMSYRPELITDFMRGIWSYKFGPAGEIAEGGDGQWPV